MSRARKSLQKLPGLFPLAKSATPLAPLASPLTYRLCACLLEILFAKNNFATQLLKLVGRVVGASLRRGDLDLSRLAPPRRRAPFHKGIAR